MISKGRASTGSAARFSGPVGVAVDGSGNVYVGEEGNHTIRRITSGGVVTTLAGSHADYADRISHLWRRSLPRPESAALQ